MGELEEQALLSSRQPLGEPGQDSVGMLMTTMQRRVKDERYAVLDHATEE